MYKRLLIPLLLVVLLSIGGMAAVFARPYEFHGSVLPAPQLEGGIVLRSAQGPVRLGDYQGKYVLLYFGYTSCPDVCPTALARLKMALDGLSAEERSQVQVIFVSVDPDRDTPEKLERYAHAFGEDFIGATGLRREIDLVADSLGVYYKINAPEANGEYSVDHSSLVYGIDRQGYLVMHWGHDVSAEGIRADLKYLLQHDIPISAQILAGPTQTPVICSLTLVPGHVDAGQWLYEHHCAQCHGMDLGGNPAWQTELADGSRLPPPLNDTGTAWKYSEQEMTAIIKDGRALDHSIYMPSFKNKLADWEVHYIIQYVASTWDVNQKNYQAGLLTLTPLPTLGPLPAATGTPVP